MIRISHADFLKLIKLLAKDGQDDATLTFDTNGGTSLTIMAIDCQTKEIVVQISDVDYPFMPRVTKTETF